MLPGAPLFTDTQNLLQLIPAQCQLGCFSATFCQNAITVIEHFRPGVKKLLQQEVPRSISHWCVRVDNDEGFLAVICDLYRAQVEKDCQTIIFSGTKQESFEMKARLNQNGFRAEVINGDLTKDQRRDIVKQFREGKFKVLVGTDAIARGLDIPQVFLVICLTVPKTFGDTPGETLYQHRAGRSGRFGRNGITFTIVKSDQEAATLKGICDRLHITLNQSSASDLSSLPKEAALA
jgi:ATP-dependent RNA helicase DDX19/DBP5